MEGIDPLNKMLFRIAKDLTADDLDVFKLLSHGDQRFPESVWDNIQKPIKFFLHLKERDIINKDNFIWLKDALGSDGMNKPKLVRLIEEFERKSSENGNNTTPSTPIQQCSDLPSLVPTTPIAIGLSTIARQPNLIISSGVQPQATASDSGMNISRESSYTGHIAESPGSPSDTINPSSGNESELSCHSRSTNQVISSEQVDPGTGLITSSVSSHTEYAEKPVAKIGPQFRMKVDPNESEETDPKRRSSFRLESSIDEVEAGVEAQDATEIQDRGYDLSELDEPDGSEPDSVAILKVSQSSDEQLDQSALDDTDSMEDTKARNKLIAQQQFQGIEEKFRKDKQKVNESGNTQEESGNNPKVRECPDIPSINKAKANKLHTDAPDADHSNNWENSVFQTSSSTQHKDKSSYQKLASGQRLSPNLARRQILRMDEEISCAKADKDMQVQKQLDDKKANMERLELIKRALKTPSTPVTLRKYQHELAQPAIGGRNCIICAPTGSGKTFTAGYVLYQRWKKAQAEGRRFKALFVVCIRNLINQQKESLGQVFNEDLDAVDGIHETIMLKEMLERTDIVVLTAQILVNSLKSKELQISDIDMMVMDECHHTNLSHPYNVVMQYYHEARRSGKEEELPQILGLTASLGVGANKENALEHYILMCANLNCLGITHVRNYDNYEELIHENPKPKKDQLICVSKRDKNDIFILILTYLMKQIENITPKISKIRPQRASQHYENWIVEMRNEAEKKHHQDTIFACQALLKLNTCLMFYDELLARDVLPILQDFFNQQNRSDELTDIAKKIYELYDAQDEELRTTSDAEKLEENPKLERLCQLLHDLYTSNIHSKGLLLARTRYTVEGLVALIRRQENLRRLVNPAKFVGQGRRDGTMTDTEQEITLLRFKEGYEETDGINLLVATDVAQEGLDMPLCNFVIRYNFVSNEIGSVQSKGRARAKNSECYLIVNKHSVNEMREYENLEKEHSMMDALEDIDKMGSDELCRGIRQKQVILYEHHRRKEEQKLVSRSQFLSEDITIHCKTCKQPLCKASSMRKRGSNYIVDDPDGTFESKTQEKKRSEPLSFRYDSHIGYISCGNKTCQGQLGPKIKYIQGTRLLGLALSKDSVMWQKAGETDFRQIKQWSKVPFPIAEESLLE